MNFYSSWPTRHCNLDTWFWLVENKLSDFEVKTLTKNFLHCVSAIPWFSLMKSSKNAQSWTFVIKSRQFHENIANRMPRPPCCDVPHWTGLGSTPELELELGSTPIPTPELELELELKPPELELELKLQELELELELIFKRLAGVGVGVENPRVGVGIGVETLGSWSWNWSWNFVKCFFYIYMYIYSSIIWNI